MSELLDDVWLAENQKAAEIRVNRLDPRKPITPDCFKKYQKISL